MIEAMKFYTALDATALKVGRKCQQKKKARSHYYFLTGRNLQLKAAQLLGRLFPVTFSVLVVLVYTKALTETMAAR
jgi:hypothetical protein